MRPPWYKVVALSVLVAGAVTSFAMGSGELGAGFAGGAGILALEIAREGKSPP
jgi:hypothetical protein